MPGKRLRGRRQVPAKVPGKAGLCLARGWRGPGALLGRPGWIAWIGWPGRV